MTNINPVILLKKSNLKVTNGRVQVLKMLSEAKYPMDVTGITAGLINRGVKIDPVTVYRILEKFMENELIEKTELQEGKYSYEILSAGHHHHHAVCLKCGLISDINDCVIDATEENLESEMHFKVQNHRLEFFGLCDKCQ